MRALACLLAASLVGCASPVREITTDVLDPPRLPDGPPPSRDGGGQLLPVYLPCGPDAVFRTALVEAGRVGWRVVRQDPAGRAFEAIGTAGWLRLETRAVVRVRPEGAFNARVDVRTAAEGLGPWLGTPGQQAEAYLTRVRGGSCP
ncbi:MAG: hypothetical protein VKS61_14035 [Candidatus Sericytochromatia bacterium]|nr:hypothetical protein [Candidatus Sericytochromatia bacterium]